MVGTVTEFDAHAGTGAIETEDGRTLAFHCMTILDGSRAVDPGTAVEFEVSPGHLGHWEATGVRPV